MSILVFVVSVEVVVLTSLSDMVYSLQLQQAR